ncbi:DUF6602 domain-containing protein [Halomonas faecis]|uniref:DUF6602 domain-containing protein n=1 Tax=Halomonas faecis TaxID=1562110 RepID=UPI0013D1598B|nr:DUF6602 domain-containing protein [Halomonas faecis]
MKIIQKHLNNIQSTLKSYYDLTSISGHSGNLGTSRELIIKHFLESNLPSFLDFTSGEVFDSSDNRSGQLDIIIHAASSMKLNIASNIDLLPVDNVLAVIECKSKLQTGSMLDGGKSALKMSLDACVKLKRLDRINPIGMDKQYLAYNKLPENTPDILFEKSGLNPTQRLTPYMITAFKGPSEEKLRSCLWEYMKHNQLSIDLMPNVITVLDKGFYLVKNDGFYIPYVKDGNVHWSTMKEKSNTLLGCYMYLMKLSEAMRFSHNFFPVSEYLK